MKTKLFTLFLALTASVGITFASVTIDGIAYKLNETDLIAVVTKGGSYSGNVVIPGQITYNAKTYSVTSIEVEAFYGCSGLTSVTIPNSITSIGEDAFGNCSSLTSVTIPNSVTSIGNSVFSGCSRLTSVTLNSNAIARKNYSSDANIKSIFGAQVTKYMLGDEITSIGNYAFQGCCRLTSIEIPNSVTSIGDRAFSGCSGLTSVTIPSSVTSIGDNAFYNCSSLTSVTIPNSVTSIGTGAFNGCSSLTSLTIPNSVTSIESGAFGGCSSLTSVAIPNSVTSIGSSAFQGCGSLTSVTIPNSVIRIYSKAFQNCSSLTSIDIPSSVTSIGESAIEGCTGLTSIVVEQGNSVYDSRNNCNAIIKTATNTLITGCKSTVIPNSVTSIGNYAFQGCSRLTSIEIPNSVTSIGDRAFSGCSGLTSVTIPNSVTSIGSSAFAGCSGMTSVTIDNGVTSIRAQTFYKCSGLTSVTIPNSVTSIGESAFSGCGVLTSVTIPNSVTSIGKWAFTDVLNIVYDGIAEGSPWGAKSMNGFVDEWLVYSDKSKTQLLGCSATATGEIIIPSSVTSIGERAFQNCSGLTSVTIPNSVTSIGDYAFYDYSMTSVTIPNSVTSIGKDAFWMVPNIVYLGTATGSPWGARSINGYVDGWLVYNNNSKIQVLACFASATGEIVIPNSVTSIGDYAFSACSNLTSVTVPNSVTSIGITAFSACSGLTSITIPNSVKSIGNWAFNGCCSLTSVIISNSVTSIGEDTFFGCSGLTSVTIPNGVTSIGESAFEGCSGLTSVSIPNSITSIGDYAFLGCKRIIDIYSYAECVPTISTLAFNGVNRKAYVWVPANRLRNYQKDEIWGEFNVKAMTAEEVNTSTVTIVPNNNTASIIWPVVDNADTYEITITDKDGKTVCTLVFNGDGILQSIAFSAPSRNNLPEQTQSTGFHFEVSGLEEGTAYDYTIVAKDVASQTLQTFNGSFKTLGGADAVADINLNAASHKILRNGEVLILRDGKTYTIQGVEVN